MKIVVIILAEMQRIDKNKCTRAMCISCSPLSFIYPISMLLIRICSPISYHSPPRSHSFEEGLTAMAPLILHSDHGLRSLRVSLLRVLLNALLAAVGGAALPHGLLTRMRLYVKLVALLVGYRRRLGLWVIVPDLLGDHEAGRDAGSGAGDGCGQHCDYCGGCLVCMVGFRVLCYG